MLQHAKAIKRYENLERTNNSNLEYGQAELHSNVNKEIDSKGVSMDVFTFNCIHQKKELKVTLQFPKHSDKKAEQEFIDGLKEIYLSKLKIGSIQSRKSALQSISTNKVSSTKEDKSHE